MRSCATALPHPRRHSFITELVAAGIAAAALLAAAAPRANSAVLLNDTLADGDRTNTALPTDSPQWFGGSAGAAYTVSAGKGSLQYTTATNSTKLWTYFTSDNSAPDGNQPHNAVTHLNVGDQLKASISFRVPAGATMGSTTTIGTNLRMGLFFDPTDARVQSNVNSDGGGGTAPWTDATGYALFFGLTSASPTGAEFQLNKRTVSNASLMGAGAAFTQPAKGGTAQTTAFDQDYTIELLLNEVSAGQLDVTASLFTGRPANSNLVLLTTQTLSDLGTSFGGVAIPAVGTLPGATGLYTDFDHFFFRDSSNADASQIDFTQFRVELIPVPEPGSALLATAVFVAPAPARRRRVARRTRA